MPLVQGSGHPHPVDVVLRLGQRITRRPRPGSSRIEVGEDLDSSGQAAARVDAHAIAFGLRERIDLPVRVQEAGSLVRHRSAVRLGAHREREREAVLHAERDLVRPVGPEEALLPVSDLELVHSVRLVVPPPAASEGRARQELQGDQPSRGDVLVPGVRDPVVAGTDLGREAGEGTDPCSEEAGQLAPRRVELDVDRVVDVADVARR